MAQISEWLDFALLQIAAESYFDRFLSEELSLEAVLKAGNNNLPGDQSDAEVLPGTARMTALQAQDFSQLYQIVDHHANDASGFSATLFRYVEEGVTQYTLSFRSTEPLPFAQGGDVNRDGLWASGLTPAADGEIGLHGFAFGQLLAMEQYFADLRDGKLTSGAVDESLRAYLSDPANRITITGYSLGGHLATIFTELHQSLVDQAYIFNGSGRGRIAGFSGTDLLTLQEEVSLIDGMLDRFSAVLRNPTAGVTQDSDRELAIYQAAQELHNADPAWNPFRSGATENLYLDARYQWAKLATLHEYGTVGTALLEARTGFKGIAVDQGATPIIQQFYGLAATSDANLIAASGLFYGPVQPILIEGQPLLVGEFGIPRFTESGSSHSLTLIVDSLTVQELIHSIDSSYGQGSAELLIKAASRTRALDGVAPPDEENVAEADSLERTVDAFRKLFRDPSLGPFPPLPSDSRVGGFANFQNRTALYAAISEISQAVTNWQQAGVTFQIDDLTDLSLLPSSDPMSPEHVAQTDTAQGLAYRYALQELNPFALIASDDLVTTALYQAHNAAGQLDLIDPINGTGTMSAQYIQDRGLFLAEKLVAGLADRTTSDGNMYFFDMSQTYELATNGNISTTRQFLFGSSENDTLSSGSNDDHLYGGSGVDLLIGNAGNDYLQGDGGGDQLEGGGGIDVLIGGPGNDLIEGGAEIDTLDGGLGHDILRGGDGTDRYVVRAIDGADTIEDSDGKGVVELDGKVLIGGLRRASDPSNVFHSADGTVTYRRQDGDLLVSGSGPLTIKNFSSGTLGIKLIQEAVYSNDLPARTEFLKPVSNPAPPPSTIQVAFFDESSNDSRLLSLPMDTDGANNVVHALGGDDFIISGGGNDELHGDDGNDEVYGGLGNDRMYGGIGNDTLFGDNVAVSTGGGDDFLDGGDGNDIMQGGAGRDVVLGGSGNDSLNGDEFVGDNSGAYDDYLDGGDGEDFVHGGSGSDVVLGGAGNDQLIGDATQFQNGAPEAGGNDVLDGGSGDDQLFGVYGDDVLNGGTGNDLVNGQDGNDVLYGDDGNDTLSGDLRIISMGSGYDTREHRGAGGHDLIFGGPGDDVLTGGEGNDLLNGGVDNDSLSGDYITARISTSDPLYWTLFTVQGDDQLVGEDGNDSLSGGFGADSLLAGQGDDILAGGEGDDVLEGGAGNDILYGEYALNSTEFIFNPFMSSIKALSGNDVLHGEDGHDFLDAGNGDDRLYGGRGNDTLQGGAGSDELFGGDGFDRLEGGPGDDTVHGGSDNDHLTDYSSGRDTLYGDDGDDFLSSGLEPQFAEEGLPPSVTGNSILIGGRGNDTYEIDGPGDLVVEATGEGIDTVNSFISYTLPDAVENLNLRGLPLTGIGNDLHNVLAGGTQLEGLGGNDTLIGLGRLDGGRGNDVLEGGTASAYLDREDGLMHILANTYVFEPGHGQDEIQENDPILNSAYYGNEDRLLFGDGIFPSDVTWERIGNDLRIRSGAEDGVRIPSFYGLRFDRGGYIVHGLSIPSGGIVSTSNGGFPAYVAPSAIEIVQFADGTVWRSDRFGAPLIGDFRGDTYQFGRGSGDVRIIDFDFTQFNDFRESDVVSLGPAVSPTDVMLSRVNGADLVMSILQTTDRLTFQSFFQTVSVVPPFSTRGYSVAPYVIEQVKFEDGTIWTVNDLINRISTYIGTSAADILIGNQAGNLLQALDGDDTLFGGDGNDVLEGGQGSDRLFGETGNDILNGGPGNDTLSGGAGADIYLWNVDNGIDTIQDIETPAGENQIHFGPGITQEDLSVSRTETTLEIAVGTGGGQIRLVDFDPSNVSGSLVVSKLQFDDGTSINTANLFNQPPIVVNPLPDLTVSEGSPFSITLPSNTFADPDPADVLTYNATLSNGDALPSWLTFDAATQTFNGSPDDAQVGGLDVLVTATDSGNLTASDVFTLTVTNVNEAPILATSIADQQAIEDAPFSFMVPVGTFADVDAGDALTYRATLTHGEALPVWLNFDGNTATFNGTALNDDVGTLNLTVRATDLGGLSVTAPFAITVQNVNDAPIVANVIPDLEAAEDSPFGVMIPSATFADPDAMHGDVLTYSATLSDGRTLPAWLSFDGGSRMLSGTPGAGDTGVLQIAVTATDREGVSVTDQFALTISGPLPKILTGTSGNDALIGGRGDDVLSGLAGNDRLTGGDGNDVLDGGLGTDTMHGGLGNDIYVVDNPGDVVTENPNEGTDSVLSSLTYTLGSNVENLTLTGTSTINGSGNALNNSLAGNSANNRLIGGLGNDRLDGGLGSDTMLGGGGDDTYVVNQAGDVVTENFNEGNDTVESGISYILGSNVENLALRGTANLNGTGNVLNNKLTGNSGNNALDGGAGSDTIDGASGNDLIFGGSGDDVLLGGPGDDTLNAGSGHDALDGGDGIDLLDGGAGDDSLYGGAGNDGLTGGSGADRFTGGVGDDRLTGGVGNDLYHFSRGDGQDTIIDTDLFPSNQDRLLFETTINPLDLVISRQANDLRLTIHGTSDSVTIQNWYTSGSTHQIEDLQAGNGQHLLNTQVDQLIQAMASFSQQSGLTWDQAIDQRPQQVQSILAASWH